MDWDVLPYLIPYLISLATSTAVGVYAWRRRDVKGAAAYAWVAFSQAFWTLGYTFELLSPGLWGKAFWDDLQWLGGIGWVTVVLAFALDYTDRKLAHSKRFWALVVLPSAIFLLLLATNGLHGWVRSGAWLVPGEPFSALEYDFTVIVWAISLYGYALALAGLAVLVVQLTRPHALYRAQLGIVIAGALIPLVGTVLTLVGVTLTFQRDTTPLTFALSNLVVSLGLFRFRLFDVVPIARGRTVEGMLDAVFVLDAKDRLVDLNPAAQEMIGQTASQAIGQAADVVLAAWPDLVERFRGVREARVEVVVGEGRDHLDLSISPLHNRRGRFTGRLIVARDVTEHRRAEEGLRRHAEQLHTINEVGGHIASILDVDELLTEIARTIQRVLGYRMVGLALIEDDELVFRAGAGGSWDIPAFEPPRLQVGQQGITGWVAHSGEPLVVPDVSQEPRHYATPWAPAVASALAVPLKTQDRVIGVLHAQSTDLDAFDESDLALLESLAHQAAIAIENARLYVSVQQELDARRQAEEALRIAHGELERRVEERTAELSAANLSLRKAVVERGRAEAQRDATMTALQENEEHYRTLFESANDAIFVVLQDRFVDCNPATEAMFGYERDFLVGKTPYQLSPPYQPDGSLSRQEAMDRIEAALAGTPQSFEWRHRRADGMLFDAEVRLNRMQVGGEWMTLAAVRDITERKHAEDLLRASEERYRLLAENVDDVLWVRDASLERYTYVSPSVVRLLGYTPEEMLDKSSSDYVAASSYPHVLQAAERRLTAEAAGRGDDETRTFEVEYVRRDGSTVWVESRTRPLRGEDGRFQGLIGVTRDISARKWVQQALRLYADRLEVLHEIDQGILAARSPEAIAQAALKHIRQLVPCQRASVTLIERATSEAVILAADESTEAIFGSGHRIPLDRFAELPAASPEGMFIKLEDLPVENADVEALRALGIRGFYTMPLFFQDEHIGTLSLGLADASALGEEQRGLIRQVADQLAIAIANARLYESERRQRQVAEILLETSTAVASTLNLEQALLTLAGQLRSLSGFHACLICEVTESGESVCGLAEHARGTWRPGGGSTYRLAEYPSIERVLTSGQPEAIHVDDQGLTAAERSSMSAMGIATLLNLPLRSGDRVIGLAEIARPVSASLFDPRAAAHCQDILSQAASWLTVPLAENDGDKLYDLGRQLAEAASGTNCDLLSWQPAEGTVQTAMVHVNLVWPPDLGPVFSLGEYPAMAHVLASGKPVVIWPNRPHADASHVPQVARWGEQTVVVLPLTLKGMHVGLVELVHCTEEREVTEQDLRLWQAVADQTTIALENARLYARSERYAETLEHRVSDRTRELQTMYEVMSIASQHLDLDTMLTWSLERVLTAVKSEAGGIHLLDEEGVMLHLAAHKGAPPDLVSDVASQPADRGLLGWVVQHGEPLIVPDLAADPRTDIAYLGLSLSYAGVPLRAGGRILGVFSVLRESALPLFDEAELALLTSLADRVGAVVESAQLRQRAERAAVLEERYRLARDLHDSVTQSLYSLTLLAETGRRSANAGDLESVANYVGRLGEVSQQALKEMRLLIYELRPSVLEQEGLVGALQQRLDAVEGRAGVEARLLVEGEARLGAPVEDALYRIAVEALNNALKHAAATSVTVHMAAQDGLVELKVVDNGRGFDPETAGDTGGMGLITMRERAEQLAGTLDTASVPGEGTTVRVRIQGTP